MDKPVSLTEVLSGYVELSQPATAQDLRTLIDATTDDAVRAQLVELQESYQKTVLSRRICVLDLLEKHPNGISLDLATYLRMLPPMRIRQYSISSSPLWNAEHVTLTVSVLDAEPLSGEGKTFLGVASNYLSELVPGDRVQMSVRASAAAFRLPEDPEIPLLAYCAGSGLAPLRGFIQVCTMLYNLLYSLNSRQCPIRREPCRKCLVEKLGRYCFSLAAVIPRETIFIQRTTLRNGQSSAWLIFVLRFRGFQNVRRDANIFKSTSLTFLSQTVSQLERFQSIMG